MKHVMLDLETFGTRPGSVLRSIGAVEFELDGAIGDTFYRNIDYISCLEAGLTVDAATKEWWKRQSMEAEACLLVDQHPLISVVVDFHCWFIANAATHIWCHGANFDEPLWSAAARAVQKVPPWKYWNTRCTRTAYDLMQFDARSVERVGVAHNALNDARHQIECLQRAAAQFGLLTANA